MARFNPLYNSLLAHCVQQLKQQIYRCISCLPLQWPDYLGKLISYLQRISSLVLTFLLHFRGMKAPAGHIISVLQKVYLWRPLHLPLDSSEKLSTEKTDNSYVFKCHLQWIGMSEQLHLDFKMGDGPPRIAICILLFLH